jgi:hypothetical protein
MNENTSKNVHFSMKITHRKSVSEPLVFRIPRGITRVPFDMETPAMWNVTEYNRHFVKNART